MLQIKVIIGTIAFMLSMIILGFAALREPARMQTYTAAAEARSIESGAHIYYNNCASCHGIDGDAQACFDAATGESITCQGLPLNNKRLVCSDISARMKDWGWKGSKYDFIYMTVASGRNGGVMPTWSQEFGGPLQPNEVDNVVRFVLNWEDEELCSAPDAVFSWPENDSWDDLLLIVDVPEGWPSDIPLTLPLTYPGDAERGKALYEGSGGAGLGYACATCHGQVETAGSNPIGPWLGNIGNDAGTRIDGYSAEQYLYESIVNPGAFLTSGCPAGDCSNAMPATFKDQMSPSPQDMVDIITFLMEQKQ